MQTISTQYGELIPQHTDDDLRKREILPVEYHASGALKSAPLEKQTMFSTSVGEIPGELVSFHENGAINRIFPLNGKLSGYWSQDDEFGLTKPVTLTTPIGLVRTKVMSVSFYDDGSLRSLTLWPSETLSVPTPVGPIETRIGVSFDRDGKVRSLEPAKPTVVPTRAGEINAYDPDAVGVNGDANSLMFDEDGKVCRVITTLTKLTVVHPDGHTHCHIPENRESLCSEAEQEVVPMTVTFTQDTVSVSTNPDAAPLTLPREGHLPQLANPFVELHCSV